MVTPIFIFSIFLFRQHILFCGARIISKASLRGSGVSTVYIDVYFLINFTVDLLAFHLASAFTKVCIKNSRLFIASLLSALYACIILFLPMKGWALMLISALTMIVVSYALVGGISLLRRFKLMSAFVLFLTVIGGMVYLAFNTLDAYFPEQIATAVQNRRLLILSVLLLLSIGIIRLLLVLFYHSTSEKSARVKIELCGRVIECDALVDSGNLLKDPIDLTPVMMIKADAVKKLFPQGMPRMGDSDFGGGLNHFIRLIPINKNGNKTVVVGIRPERAYIVSGKRYSEIKLTFIIDEEEGRYGGYEALLPLCALENT